MKKKYIVWILVLFGLIPESFSQEYVLDLSGVWQFAMDDKDVGEQECWFDKSLEDVIQLPGTIDLAGKGIPNELSPALEKPQMLHLTRRHSYVGPAWYSREIEIPASWRGRKVSLFLERVMWQSKVWIDSVALEGVQESLTTPHRFDLPSDIRAGKHRLTIRIDNRKQYDISVKDLAHAYTNDTQIMWNGVLGRLELRADNPVFIEDVQLYPDVARKKVHCVVTVQNAGKRDRKATLSFCPKMLVEEKKLSSRLLTASFHPGRNIITYDYVMDEDAVLWNEFSPVCYQMDVTLVQGKKSSDFSTRFGMRNLSTSGSVLMNNGDRIYLRGTLECCVFPLTGIPPTDREGWNKVFSVAKSYGLNHLRFHSWCPPRAAFEVADDMGFYLQVELPLWSLTVGKDTATNRFLYEEADRILKEYGNHPSFCLMSVGNELQPDFDFLNDLRSYMKSKDNRHLYMATTFTFEKGHGDWPEIGDDFFVTQWTKKGWVRGQGIFNDEAPCFDKDYTSAVDGISVPLISHEIGQYAVYPNLKEIEKYKGVLDPLNFKSVKADLREKGLLAKADGYLNASGKLAAILYKEEIERALKTPGFSGFQLLDLHDFPGQGTALVGLLDAFWDSKGIISAENFRNFCSPVVPLTRFPKAVYTNNELFEATVEIANYSASDIKNRKISWNLLYSGGESVASGYFDVEQIEKGKNSVVGNISASLGQIANATCLTLEVAVTGTAYKNNWPIWVYPENIVIDTGKVFVTDDLDEALSELSEGKKVLFSPPVGALKGIEGKFVPVFWSPIHFPKQAGSMGILCDSEHLALSDFPTESHTNWQWWHLLKNSKTLVVDSIAPISAIIEHVDNFANNRRLVSIFEAACNGGKLLFSSMDILSEKSQCYPEVRQLLYSLLNYMNSDAFNPCSELSKIDLNKLVDSKINEVKTSNATSIY
ncbi:sugar-binding domain-containing protein [uncultured Coprobacter sp.]|uniref:sugar-binding domain-containing protein n=1 Tax=uncultured Coprobacter sp. TaxID=1720550 RepID=UPI0026191F52|nr:sugar-binding domain-containing protein [uncultured Coprobacter sp.]